MSNKAQTRGSKGKIKVPINKGAWTQLEARSQCTRSKGGTQAEPRHH